MQNLGRNEGPTSRSNSQDHFLQMLPKAHFECASVLDIPEIPPYLRISFCPYLEGCQFSQGTAAGMSNLFPVRACGLSRSFLIPFWKVNLPPHALSMLKSLGQLSQLTPVESMLFFWGLLLLFLLETKCSGSPITVFISSSLLDQSHAM